MLNDSVTTDRRDQAPTPPDARSDLTALDRSIRSGVAWTSAAKLAVQIASWASTILVVRLLTPADYGIVGMATAFVAILQPLCDFGIAAAVVQDRTLTGNQIARLNGLAVLIGLGCALATLAATIPIASFFKEPLLRSVVPVVGLGFFTGSFRLVPGARLARDLRFRTLAMIEAVEGLTVLVVTLSTALMGGKYWSLVVGTLAGRTMASILAVALEPTPLALTLRSSPIARSLRFGAWVAASTLAWYVYSNADRVVVGRLIGEASLGAYTIAVTLAALAVEKISPVYQRAFESILARVQHERQAVARYLMRVTEAVSLLSFPLSAGIALVADQIVDVVLGARWEPVVAPMRLLALASAVRSLDPPLAQVLVATGHAKENARTMIVATLVLPLAFFASAVSGGGLAGVAAVWLIAHPTVVMSRQLWHALRIAESSMSAYLSAISPAATCTALMSGAVLLVRIFPVGRAESSVGLAINAATGAITYAVALVVLYPHRLRAMWSVLRDR